MPTLFENSTGNVFLDLGLPNPEKELVKAKLTCIIYKLLKDQKLTQKKAAKLLGTTQPQVSALMRCSPVSVSVIRLMEYLTLLGQDVTISIQPNTNRKAQEKGHISISTSKFLKAP
jgi:predicted XRE-type DNA-binding protein